MRHLLLPFAALPLLAGGCLSTVGTIVTAPVKVAGKAVDMATTSRAEADRNYGKKMRKAEEREGRERKAHDKDCAKHRDRPCPPYSGFRAHSEERD
jgi:hypothetical protein